MKILLISPYHGGSHFSWAVGYQSHSDHQVELLTLPARFWKWRMHGGAVTLARRFLDQALTPDLLLVTDMLDLTTFLALTRQKTADIPTVLFMHENQLTYPLPEDGTAGPMRRQLGERDHHYAFVNYTSMMAADRIFFNSDFHRQSYFAALPKFLKHFPEYKELGSVKKLEQKSDMLPVGIDLQRLAATKPPKLSEEQPQVPLILWNQRWEYDKNPEAFFATLIKLAGEGLPFTLALCGEQYGKQPTAFTNGIAQLAERIIHAGYASPGAYAQILRDADITISTAHHEFFGISIIEAIFSQTFPILPNRLSYPEIIPERFHLKCLYQNQGGLVDRLRWSLLNQQEARAAAVELATAVVKYDWSHMAPQYDELLASMA